MYKIQLGKNGPAVPTMAVGCMRISNMSETDVSRLVDVAMSEGVNFFDHANIYDGGECERIFGRATSSIPREDIFIQDKCGIVPGKMYDFSYDHITKSVDESLKRLNTDYIDILLLHRPDALMEPEEVARAFDRLMREGKVRHFGVSNQNPYQMELLKKHLDVPICTNQIQFGIMHMPSVQSGMNFNLFNDLALNRDAGVIDYCRLNDITIQTWSSLQYGFFEGCFIDNEKFGELNRVLGEIAEKYSVSKTTIAISWILRHPAKMQPVTGTTNSQRLRECFRATEINLTREEWYKIYLATGSVLP